VSDTLLHSTLRELRALLIRPRLWLVFGLMIGLFSVTGPFGSYERLPFVSRLGYWLTMNTATWATALVCISFVKAALIVRVPHQITRLLIGGAVSSLPVGLAITVINTAVIKSPLNLEQFAGNVLVALPIAIGFCLLSWLSLGSGEQAAEQQASASQNREPASTRTSALNADRPAAGNAPGGSQDRPPLLDRISLDKRGPLIRLEVQDHYVLVVTTRGRELLLMRLGDAIAETGADTGQQIHRSHWVSDNGVRAVLRESGKNPRLTVQTTDGQSLPVSRSQMPDVRARWGDRIGGA
jgi:hypothetical protein